MPPVDGLSEPDGLVSLPGSRYVVSHCPHSSRIAATSPQGRHVEDRGPQPIMEVLTMGWVRLPIWLFWRSGWHRPRRDGTSSRRRYPPGGGLLMRIDPPAEPASRRCLS